MARVALYARVSTNKDQTVENQLLALRLWAEGHGHEIVEEFADEGISGAKGREKRPRLDAMLKGCTDGRFDLIAATALDRLGRSLSHLVEMAAELEALHVGLYVKNMSIDTSTPAGRMFFGVMASMAQFERELARERTLLGIERARKEGKRIGRPPTLRATERKVIDMLYAGVSINKIARITRLGFSAIYRIKALSEAAND